MSLKRFANFFENTVAYKQGIYDFHPSFKTSQKWRFLTLPKRFANFSFLPISTSPISSAFAKVPKPEKFANQTLPAKSKSIYELFKNNICRINRASQGFYTLQPSKSDIKKDMFCELLGDKPIKAAFKRDLVKIKFL